MDSQAAKKIVMVRSKKLLDMLNNDIDKMEIAPKNPCIIEATIKKMEQRRKIKITNVNAYRSLNNHLRRETERAKKKEYIYKRYVRK